MKYLQTITTRKLLILANLAPGNGGDPPNDERTNATALTAAGTTDDRYL